MRWSLSRFRTGDLVEVRSKDEILATLDADGCLDGMPFMPEMLQLCGRKLRVSAVAHKTCDTAGKTGGRRLRSSVHLVGAHCDGSSHGGCEAACNLFWKDAWLKRPGEAAWSGDFVTGKSRSRSDRTTPGEGCTDADLHAAACLPVREGEEPRYACQATRLPAATEPLPWWDLRQYVYDVLTRNHSAGKVLRVLTLAGLRALLRAVPVGYRAVKGIHDWAHRLLTGRASPEVDGKVQHGSPTPTGRLNLQPGERIRVKAAADIVETLDADGKNRGLSFDPEMAPYCESVRTVRGRVTRILDEATGRMLHMKQPCITLEGAVCRAEYSECRLLCPRAIPSYWREVWLERADEGHRLDGPSAHAPHGHRIGRRVGLPLADGSVRDNGAT